MALMHFHFLLRTTVSSNVHLMVLLSGLQVLYGAAVVQRGPDSVQNVLFTPVQSFVNPVYVTEESCSFGVLRGALNDR